MSNIQDLRHLWFKFHKTDGHKHTGAEGDAPILPAGGYTFNETVTGLTWTAATSTLSLTTGYVIPTTVEETAWNLVSSRVDQSLLIASSPTFANITISGLTITRIPYASTAGLLVDSASFTYDGTTVKVPQLTDSGLTITRIPYASTAGLLVDSASFTYDGTTVKVPQLTDSGLTITRIPYASTAGLLIDSAVLTFDGTTVTAGGLKATGTTNVNINVNTTAALGTGGYSWSEGGMGKWWAYMRTTSEVPNYNLGFYNAGVTIKVLGLNQDGTIVLGGYTTAGILHNAVTTGAITSSLIVAADVTGHTLTYATIQEVSATSRVLGRISAGAGDIEELTAANIKTICAYYTSGDSPTFAALTIDATDTYINMVKDVATNSALIRIYNDPSTLVWQFGATNTDDFVIQDMVANVTPIRIKYNTPANLLQLTTAGVIIGNCTAATAGVAHFSILGLLSNSLIVNADITANTITYASLQQVSATARVLGNVSGGAGNVAELTAANLKTMCGYYTSGDSPSFGGLVVTSDAILTYLYDNCFSDGAAWNRPILQFTRGRGTAASPTIITSGDYLFCITGQGQYDSTVGHLRNLIDIYGIATTVTDGSHFTTKLTLDLTNNAAASATCYTFEPTLLTCAGSITATGLTVNGATVLNEGSGDYDFRVESDGNANAFFLDAGASTIGINRTPGAVWVANDITVDIAGTILRLQNTTAGDGLGARFILDKKAATDSNSLLYYTNGVVKWQIGCLGSDVLRVYDEAASKYRIAITTAGDIQLGDLSGTAYTSITYATGAIVTTGLTVNSDSGKITLGAGSDMTMWYDGTYGQLKTSDVAASDLRVTCGANKTIELQNVVYDDVQFFVAAGKVPAANYPTWETFTTNTSAFAFSVNDYIDLQANELPHTWKQGTAGDMHLHFTIKTAQSTGADRYAKFTIYVAYADTNEAWVEQAALTYEATIPTGSAALTNFYLDMGDATLTNYLIGGQIICRVKRIAATGGTEYADDVYITQVGMHHQIDTMGSRSETTK